MGGLDGDLARAQHDRAPIAIEGQVDRAAGVEVQHAAVGQHHGEPLAGAGAVVGAQGGQRLEAVDGTEPQQQRGQQPQHARGLLPAPRGAAAHQRQIGRAHV